MQRTNFDSNKLANGVEALSQGPGDLTNALLEALLSANRDGVFAFDADLRLFVINRQALHYLGLPGSPEDWLYHDLGEFVTELRRYAPEAVEPFRAEMLRHHHGDDSRSEGEFRTWYGIIHWLNLPMNGISPAGMPHSSPGRLVVLCDVTAQRMATSQQQDWIRLLVDSLQEPLTRVTEAMRYLAASDSETLPEDSQHVLSTATGEVDHALATVRQFLDFSRLESGQLPLSMSAFPLPDLISRVISLEQQTASRKSLKLEQRTAQSLPLAWGDRGLIERVLGELVAGVLDVTPPGGTVRVEANLVSADYSKMMVSVRDDRMGDSGRLLVGEAEGLRINEPSPPYQLATVRDLNFAFCRKVVEAHGERIWISRTGSSGIAVTFTLPQVSESLVSVGLPPV